MEEDSIGGVCNPFFVFLAAKGSSICPHVGLSVCRSVCPSVRQHRVSMCSRSDQNVLNVIVCYSITVLKCYSVSVLQ